MAIEFRELESLLEKAGIKAVCDYGKQMLVCLGKSLKGGLICLEIRLLENGEALHFRIPLIATIGPNDLHRGKAFEVLLQENHVLKIGRTCFDPSDGEVYVDWFHPIEDGVLTHEQLRRCVLALISVADELGGRVRHILDTGEDLPPKERGLKGILRALAQRAAQSGAPRRIQRLLDELIEVDGGIDQYRAILDRFQSGLDLGESQEDDSGDNGSEDVEFGQDEETDRS